MWNETKRMGFKSWGSLIDLGVSLVFWESLVLGNYYYLGLVDIAVTCIFSQLKKNLLSLFIVVSQTSIATKMTSSSWSTNA